MSTDNQILRLTEKPERPLSAYNMFFRLQRDRLLHLDQGRVEDDINTNITASDVAKICLKRRYAEGSKRRHRKTHGRIGFTELTKLISDKWKSLPKETRNLFEERATEQKKLYKFQMEAWKSSLESIDRSEVQGRIEDISFPGIHKIRSCESFAKSVNHCEKLLDYSFSHETNSSDLALDNFTSYEYDTELSATESIAICLTRNTVEKHLLPFTRKISKTEETLAEFRGNVSFNDRALMDSELKLKPDYGVRTTLHNSISKFEQAYGAAGQVAIANEIFDESDDEEFQSIDLGTVDKQCLNNQIGTDNYGDFNRCKKLTENTRHITPMELSDEDTFARLELICSSKMLSNPRFQIITSWKVAFDAKELHSNK